jgi:hypothetical protein
MTKIIITTIKKKKKKKIDYNDNLPEESSASPEPWLGRTKEYVALLSVRNCGMSNSHFLKKHTLHHPTVFSPGTVPGTRL